MGCLIDCQLAYVSWGERARFRNGKVGLLRKGPVVYLAFLFASRDGDQLRKVAIARENISILPAAIRLRSAQKDLFIRNVRDQLRYQNILRSLKVLLRQQELRQAGKGPKLDKLIADIPSADEVDLRLLTPAQTRFTYVGKHFTGLDKNQSQRKEVQQDDRAMCHHYSGLVGDQDNGGDGDFNDGDVKMLSNSEAQELEMHLQTRQHLRYMKTIGVRDLPANLCFADSLNRLALIECNLAHVPKSLERLSRSLSYLDLSRNNINNLPRTFCCKMNNLQYLNLSHNSIETLPLEIKFFSRLVDLDISNNHLRLLPTTFSDLRKLRTLNVANNHLSQLPAFRKEDIRLEILDISSNPLDGALDSIRTFEVFPSYDDGSLAYQETAFSHGSPQMANMERQQQQHQQQNRVPKLFEVAMLKVVRCDFLFKLASEESLPKTIVSAMQRDVFKCFRCNKMNMLPAYNSTDYLDYVEQVSQLITSQNYRARMTFMKLLCRDCFGHMYQ